MIVRNYLKQKIETYKLSHVRNILINPSYLYYLIKEYNSLEIEPIPDFVLYAFHNIEDELNQENYKEYLILLDNIHQDYIKESLSKQLDDKYFAKNYLEIPTIKSLNMIIEKFESIKIDFMFNEFDRYKEVNVFVSFLIEKLKLISHIPIKIDVLNFIINSEKNQHLEIENFNSKNTKEVKSVFENWKAFKDNLDLELKYLLSTIENNIEDYDKDDEIPEGFHKTINNILTDGSSSYEWKNMFKRKVDYDNFLEIFTLFAKKEIYAKKEIQINKKIRTILFKKLRSIHSEISNNTLINDTQYFELLRCIDAFKDLDDKKLYKNLTRG